MATYSDIVQDSYLRPIPGASVFVFNRDGTEADVAPNPVLTDTFGAFSFNADDAVYDLEFRYGGVTLRQDSVIVGNPDDYKGDPGPAANFRLDLAALKAAATTDLSSTYDRSLWTWETASAPYTADDVNVVEANSTALAVGAWVRQKAASVPAFLPTGSLSTVQKVASSQPLYASLLGYTGAATSSGLSQLGAFATQIAGLGRPGVWDLPTVDITRPETWPDGVRLAIRAGTDIRCLTGLAAADSGAGVIYLGNNTEITGESLGEWTATSYVGSVRTDDVYRWVFRAIGKANVAIRQCYARSIGVILTEASVANYSQIVVGTNTASNITISGGGYEFLTQSTGSTGGIALFYTIGGLVENLRIKNPSNGVQVWGGNANIALDGALGNIRKSSGVVVRNCRVTNAAGCWVFYVMSTSGAVYNCIGDGAGDVGFDMEGCGDAGGNGVYWHNCSGKDAHNGVFSTFWLNRGGGFINPIAYQSNPAWPALAVVNPTQTTGNRDLLVVNPDFQTDGGIGTVAIDTAVANIVIQGGKSRNYKWKINANNHWRGSMSGTIVGFDYTSTTQFRAIDVAQFHQNGVNPASFVISNVVINSSPQGGASLGVYMTTNDPNADVSMIVENCKIEGFTTDIMFDNAVPTGNTRKGVFQALRNTVRSKFISSVNSGAATGVFVSDGNRGFDGATI